MLSIHYLPINGNKIEIAVVDRFEYAGRPMVRARALNGCKFTQFTHGGPAVSEFATVPADQVQVFAGSWREFYESDADYPQEWLS